LILNAPDPPLCAGKCLLAVITAAGQNWLFGAGGVSVAAHLVGGVPAAACHSAKLANVRQRL